MDPNLIAAQPSGLEAWLSANQAMLSLVSFASQIVYWLGMVVLIGYAVWQYKKWVNFQLGIGKSGQLRDHAPSTEEQCAVATDAEKSGAAKPSVDEFVE